MPATATPPRRTVRLRTEELHESYAFVPSPTGPQGIRVDEAAGVIYGVKVLGNFSPQGHGRPGVKNGTEYTRDAMQKGVGLYEGVSVYCDHPQIDKHSGRPVYPKGGVRPVSEALGVLRNAKYDPAGNCIRADLHYYKSHSMAGPLAEDAQRGLGGLALSHNAMPGRERVENGKLLIEAIARVHSVDLVSKGATNKNLWESAAVTKTLREILEAYTPKTKIGKTTLKGLLEDDSPPMSASSDAPAEGGDPEAELWAGFKSAISAIIDGDGTAEEKAKKIGQYLKAHEKLTTEKEPPAKKADDSDSGDGEPDGDAPTKESLQAELTQLKTKEAVRTLCEAAGYTPTPTALKALTLLESEADRKAFIDEHKGRPTTPTNRPKSGAPTPARKVGPDGKPLQESKAPASAEDFAKFIQG